MKASARVVLAAALLALGGCASVPQSPVTFSESAYVSSPQPQRIGVAMAPLPKIDTYLPGASCLLCYAAASLANSSLTSHAHTLPYEQLPNLKGDIADLLRKKGLTVTVIDEALTPESLPSNRAKGLNVAKKDFSSLKAKYNVDKLLVIEVSSLGFVRSYSAYIPTSDPQGTFTATGYIVDLGTNTYDWYLPVGVAKSAEGDWKEPPAFPGLTNAYFQALETGRDEFLKPFAQQ